MIVGRGDLATLKDRLRETGLPESDIHELERAVKADEAEPKPTDHHLGKNVGKWIGDTFKKAATGAIKVGTDVIATVVKKYLEDYYGVSGGM
jgi:hypothetical protein